MMNRPGMLQELLGRSRVLAVRPSCYDDALTERAVFKIAAGRGFDDVLEILWRVEGFVVVTDREEIGSWGSALHEALLGGRWQVITRLLEMTGIPASDLQALKNERGRTLQDCDHRR